MNSNEKEHIKSLSDSPNAVEKCCFLTGKEIDGHHEEIFEGSTYERDPDTIDRAMYDMRLGTEVFVSDSATPTRLNETSPFVSIKPGEFAILTTHERLTLPADILGFISLKFKWASRGLINISGFHVDPGYIGTIVFSVYNAGPN